MNTHPEQWAAMLQRPGSSWGFGALLKDTSVVVLKEDTPPTNNPCRTGDSNPQPSAYKSDSLSIRPRLPLMVEGLAPFICAVVHSQVTICRRLWIQYVFPHMCGVNQFCIIVSFAAVRPANNILFCIELCNTETRIIIKKTQTWVNKPINL